MEKEHWKYLVEIDMLFGTTYQKGYYMYFHNLDQALTRVTEINLRDFIAQAEYIPFKGSQIKHIGIRNLETDNILLEVAAFPEIHIDHQPDKRAPGIYFNFPQGVSDFVTSCGVDARYFPARGNSQLIAYLTKGDSRWVKPAITYEALQRTLRSNDENRFTVDYESRYFKNSNNGPREIPMIDGMVEQYYFNNVEDAFHKILSTDFDKLDESVAWEKGAEFYYDSVGLYQGADQIATLRSVRTGILQVGPYYPKEPGVFLKMNIEYKGYIPLTTAGICEAVGILRLGNYNEMRDSVIILDEVRAYRSQKNAKGHLRSVKKTVQKNVTGKRSSTRIKRRKQ